MKLVEELYDMYKDHITGDEEDAFIIIEGVLSELSDKDLKTIFNQASYKERYSILLHYLYHEFISLAAEKGLGTTNNEDDQISKNLH
ncbi:DUF6154 family protein [Thalassobacillus sp. C254]|uniref:DUF6154 family protein n=1 Tax=Thalassobacillus sp. C254 TaxID=1225341 RepID=UPI0006D20BDF|nr:DUF6154 family protein [Thalassobacillus sp. C254]